MPGSAGTGESQVLQVICIKSDTDPRKGLGTAVSYPGIIRTFAKGLREVKRAESLEAGSPIWVN